jgi:hypothetical protein
MAASARWVPENPQGGGATAEHLSVRHHASIILALGASAAAGAPDAVSQLQGLRVPASEPDRPEAEWYDRPFRATHDPHPDVAFLEPKPRSTLRTCLEYWIEKLAANPAEIDGLEARLQGAGWRLELVTGIKPRASMHWWRLDPLPPLPETANATAVAMWRDWIFHAWGSARGHDTETDTIVARLAGGSVPPVAPRIAEFTVTLSIAAVATAARLLNETKAQRRGRPPREHPPQNNHGAPPAREAPRSVRSHDRGVTAPSRDNGSLSTSEPRSHGALHATLLPMSGHSVSSVRSNPWLRTGAAPSG